MCTITELSKEESQDYINSRVDYMKDVDLNKIALPGDYHEQFIHFIDFAQPWEEFNYKPKKCQAERKYLREIAEEKGAEFERNNTFNMLIGNVNSKFYEECKVCCSDQSLIDLMNIMNHVDTYYSEGKYRLQGWIKVSDCPEGALIEGRDNFQLKMKEGVPVYEIWYCYVSDELGERD